MKFSEMKYVRPDMDNSIKYIEETIKKIKDAKTAQEQIKLIYEIDKWSSDFYSNISLAEVRHSIDMNDIFYKEEQDWIDENIPLISTKLIDKNKAIFNSKFKDELIKEFGKHLFDLIECELLFDDRAVPYIQKENALVTQYQKIIADSQIEFDGNVYTITQMTPLLQNMDSDKRKGAYEALWEFFNKNQDKFDEIYDKLVKVRTEKAKALGFNNYIELRYKELKRTDYNAKDVAEYREKIRKFITPLAVELRKKQAEKIGIKDFKFYDRPIDFLDGNSKPKGDVNFIVKNAQKMYGELSPETKEFFDFMVENELLNLVAKKGKRAGGYCTSFNKYKSPFIFSNFNGTNGDIHVITHEAGHAFQNYMSQNMPVSEYIWSTYESAEIHSMSMEFLTWPWMELFFEEDADKFKFSALKDSIVFLPYGVTIDHFQHWVYENPDATPEERRKKYSEIERMYEPDLEYDNDFLNNGGKWFKQGHVFASPFYYIDYTLAQVCAFQYLLRYLDNREKTLANYIELCKAGGKDSFYNLLKIGKLENPITTNIVEKVAQPLREILNTLEDKVNNKSKK